MVISSRTADQLEAVADRVRDAGRRALVVPADLRDLDAVAGLARAAYDEFGRLDTVVNNVGGTIPNAFLDTDVDYLEEAFRFNVSTAHALSRAAVPLMLKGPDDAQQVDRQHQLDDGPRPPAAATSPTAPPRPRSPTGLGSRRATWLRGSGSTASSSAR